MYFRLISIAQIAIMFPATFLLLFFKKKDYPHLAEQQSEERKSLIFHDELLDTPREKPQNGLLQSLKVFKEPFFWILLWGYFVGIGSSVFVLTNATQIWLTYNADPSLSHWESRILFIFSFVNGGSNVFCGVFADWLSRKKMITHNTFLSICMLLMALLFSAIGILCTIPHADNETALVAILLACTGAGFGCYLVCFPVVVIDAFGPQNFGKYFGYLQFSSCVASLGVPQAVIAIKNASGDYTIPIFGIAGLLLTGAAGFVFIPKHKTTPNLTKDLE